MKLSSIIKTSLAVLPLLFIGESVTSCTGIQDEYCRRSCYLIIDNSTHVDATLASAMNPMTPGIFCVIREVTIGGAQHYAVYNNNGQNSNILLNAIDLRRTRIIGFNNGVIVGYGNLDFPAIFYAYDRECPNCFDPDAMPIKTKALSLNEKGHATCKVCGRVYDMNNRGYIIQGEPGKPLNRFPATCTGSFGVLAIQ